MREKRTARGRFFFCAHSWLRLYFALHTKQVDTQRRVEARISAHLKLPRIWLRHPWEHSMSSESNSIRSLRYAKRSFNSSSTIYGQMKRTAYESQMCRYCWGIWRCSSWMRRNTISSSFPSAVFACTSAATSATCWRYMRQHIRKICLAQRVVADGSICRYDRKSRGDGAL